MHTLAKLAFLAPLAGAACLGDSGHACTLIGCDSGARFDLGPLPVSSLSLLAGSTVEVCLNSVCRNQVIAEPPPPNDVKSLSLSGSMEPRIQVSLWRTDPSGAIQLEVNVSSLEHEVFHDGDVYTVKLVGSDASPLVDRAWSASYRTWQPNGPDCEPTCRAATVTSELPR